MTLDNIKQEIDKANSILLLGHEGPDGDAIGSCLAMYHALKAKGKDAEVAMMEFPATYKYLPGSDKIVTTPSKSEYDLVILQDCPDKKRAFKEYWDYIDNAKMTVSIDHHSKNTMFAVYNYVNPASPACCQILLNVFDYFNVKITKDIATCLLTGIITDTGGFKNAGVTEETFEFASEAIAMGINLPKVYRQAMLIVSKPKFELEKIAMDRMEFLADGRIAYTYITAEDMEKTNMKPGDHEGIVEIGRNIDGVEVSVFIYEKPDGFKVSLRSNEYVNVADICMMYGGGGHVLAAGCSFGHSLDEARDKIISEIKKQLK